MNDRPDVLLDPLEPPAGGLDRLRARIGRHERRRRLARRGAGVLAAAVVAVAAFLVGRLDGSASATPLPVGDELDAIALGLVEPPSEPVSVPADRRASTSVFRVPTRNPRVALYLVASSESTAQQ